MIHHQYIDELTQLPICALRYTLIAEDEGRLFGDLTPTLRGAIGWALSEIGCLGECQWSRPISNQGRSSKIRSKSAASPKHCDIDKCPYERTFNGGGWPKRGLRVLPQGYRLLAPIYSSPHSYLPGEEVSFTLYLFGEASHYAPLWTQAIIKAAAKGIGDQPRRFHLAEAIDLHTQEALYERCAPYPPRLASRLPIAHLIDLPPASLLWSDLGIRVRLQRPWVIRKVGQRPALSQFCRANLRRSHAMYNRYFKSIEHPLHGDEIDFFSQAIQHGQLKVHTQKRYSSTAQRSIPQTGLIGDCLYTQIQSPDWVYKTLCLGAYLGIGQQANMGLGACDVELVDLSHDHEKVLAHTTAYS